MFVGSRRQIKIILTHSIIALEESLRTARARGQSIERDSEGLPKYLLLPTKDSSIGSFVIASSLPNVISMPIRSCGTVLDSPPRELLEEVTIMPVVRDTNSQASDSSTSTIKGVTPFGGKQSAFKEVNASLDLT